MIFDSLQVQFHFAQGRFRKKLGERFPWFLELVEVLVGNDHRHWLAVARNGLHAAGQSIFNDSAQLVFGFLKLPSVLHAGKLSNYSGLSSQNLFHHDDGGGYDQSSCVALL